MILLNRNECPFPPSRKVWLKIKEYINALNRYEIPELVASLRRRLSDYVDINDKYVHIIPGSEAFFIYLREYMLLERLTFIYSSPTFMPASEDLSALGVETLDVPLTKDFKLDYLRLMSMEGTDKVLYIINPNNPTGNQVIDCESITKLLHHYRLVILDEAYYEFSSITCKDLISKYSNLIILRTFSKAFCLAGARIGYIIAQPEVASDILRTAREYDTSTLSLSAALGALNDLNYMFRTVKRVREIRDHIVRELSHVPDIEVINTLCNFILLKKRGYSSTRLSREFLRYGIIVKSLGGRLKEFIRVSIGTDENMREFLRVLEGLNHSDAL